VIGVKSAGAIALAAPAIAAAAWGGRLGADYLSTLGATSCFAIGLFAGLSAALVAVGWRPRAPSRLAIGVRGRRIIVEPTASARDLPAAAQRTLLVAAFACVGLAVFTNPGTARLLAVPGDLSEPSAGEYCRPPKPVAADAEPPPPPKAVEIPGCALVKRAVALGLSKDLGSCAPRTAPPAVKAAIAAQQPCELRQVDEPFFHYAWRRLSGAGGSLAGANPIDAARESIHEKEIQFDHLEALVAAQGHAITGTPHAAHEVFVTLPDPHPGTWIGDLLDPPHCDARYADLPVWPAADLSASALVDHVIGQLLFTSRFGTTASCRDYAIHWSAPADACDRLAADPVAFLAEQERLEPVRDVLDRRRGQLDRIALETKLGKKPPPAPPEARTVVSFTCFVVDPSAPPGARAAAVTGTDTVVDGERVSVRSIRVPEVRTSGGGVIDLYERIATVLGGDDGGKAVVDIGEPIPPLDTGELSHDEYLLVRLDRLHDADPFAGHTWPLDRADVLEVYPAARHLGAFVDAFRRRYRAQRGRL
jgi:hypothetical protein